MGFSYNKLWKLLIDKKMKKKDLERVTNLSHSTIVKLSKEKNVNTNVLERICKALNCKIEDIVELKENSDE